LSSSHRGPPLSDLHSRGFAEERQWPPHHNKKKGRRKEGLDAPVQDVGEKSSHGGGGQAAPGEAKPKHLLEKPIHIERPEFFLSEPWIKFDSSLGDRHQAPYVKRVG
jgi:hypothetical protein